MQGEKYIHLLLDYVRENLLSRILRLVSLDFDESTTFEFTIEQDGKKLSPLDEKVKQGFLDKALKEIDLFIKDLRDFLYNKGISDIASYKNNEKEVHAFISEFLTSIKTKKEEFLKKMGEKS